MDYRKLAAERPIKKKSTNSEAAAPPTSTTPHPTAPQTPSPVRPRRGQRVTNERSAASITTVPSTTTATLTTPPAPVLTSTTPTPSAVPPTPLTPTLTQNTTATPATSRNTRRSLDLDKSITIPKPKAKTKRKNISKRTNTPAFGLALSYRVKQLKKNIKVKQFAKIVQQLVACIGDPTTTGLRRVSRPASVPKWESWAFCYGFLEDVDLWKLSTGISWQLTFAANEQGWGADSQELWSKRPIHFRNNSGTNRLQWAKQVRHVFPVSSERYNWATQFKARTRGLRAAAVKGFHDGTKWIHRVPRCFTCRRRT